MSFSIFQIYLRAFFPRVPLWHWVVMGVVALALTVVLIGQKRFSVYRSIAWGVAVFVGLNLLDALNRIGMEGDYCYIYRSNDKNGFEYDNDSRFV